MSDQGRGSATPPPKICYLGFLLAHFGMALGLVLMILGPVRSLVYHLEDFSLDMPVFSRVAIAIVHHLARNWRFDLLIFLVIDALVLAWLMYALPNGGRNAFIYSMGLFGFSLVTFVFFYVSVAFQVHSLIQSL